MEFSVFFSSYVNEATLFKWLGVFRVSQFGARDANLLIYCRSYIDKQLYKAKVQRWFSPAIMRNKLEFVTLRAGKREEQVGIFCTSSLARRTQTRACSQTISLSLKGPISWTPRKLFGPTVILRQSVSKNKELLWRSLLNKDEILASYFQCLLNYLLLDQGKGCF